MVCDCIRKMSDEYDFVRRCTWLYKCDLTANDRIRLRIACSRSVITIVLFVALPSWLNILTVFDCTGVDTGTADGTVYYSDTNRSFKCYDGDWYWLLAVALLGVLLWTYFIRLLLVALGGKEILDNDWKSTYSLDRYMILGGLDAPYMPRYNRWFLFVFGKKVAFALFFTFLNLHPVWQVASTSLVMLFSGVIVIWKRPQTRHANNYLDGYMSIMSFATILLGKMFADKEKLQSWTIFVLVILQFLPCLWFLTIELHQLYRYSRMYLYRYVLTYYATGKYKYLVEATEALSALHEYVTKDDFKTCQSIRSVMPNIVDVDVETATRNLALLPDDINTHMNDARPAVDADGQHNNQKGMYSGFHTYVTSLYSDDEVRWLDIHTVAMMFKTLDDNAVSAFHKSLNVLLTTQTPRSASDVDVDGAVVILAYCLLYFGGDDYYMDSVKAYMRDHSDSLWRRRTMMLKLLRAVCCVVHQEYKISQYSFYEVTVDSHYEIRNRERRRASGHVALLLFILGYDNCNPDCDDMLRQCNERLQLPLSIGENNYWCCRDALLGLDLKHVMNVLNIRGPVNSQAQSMIRMTLRRREHVESESSATATVLRSVNISVPAHDDVPLELAMEIAYIIYLLYDNDNDNGEQEHVSTSEMLRLVSYKPTTRLPSSQTLVDAITNLQRRKINDYPKLRKSLNRILTEYIEEHPDVMRGESGRALFGILSTTTDMCLLAVMYGRRGNSSEMPESHAVLFIGADRKSYANQSKVCQGFVDCCIVVALTSYPHLVPSQLTFRMQRVDIESANERTKLIN